jgi:hypothetical protein
MSMLISASSAKLLSVIVAALAAVVLENSVASIESFVPNTLVPPSLMSTINVLPVGAVFTLARTASNVAANGIRNRTLLVPVVSAVVSSLHASTIVSASRWWV